MRTTIYADRHGMISSTEVAFHLRLAAERQRRSEELRREREARAEARGSRRREFWARVRAGLTSARRASAT